MFFETVIISLTIYRYSFKVTFHTTIQCVLASCTVQIA